MATFNKVLAAVVLQEYARAAKNTKKTTIEAIRSRILKAKELIVKGIEAKLKILVKEDV